MSILMHLFIANARNSETNLRGSHWASQSGAQMLESTNRYCNGWRLAGTRNVRCLTPRVTYRQRSASNSYYGYRHHPRSELLVLSGASRRRLAQVRWKARGRCYHNDVPSSLYFMLASFAASFPVTIPASRSRKRASPSPQSQQKS